MDAPIATGCLTGIYGSKRKAVVSPGARFGIAYGRPGSTAGSGKLGIASTVA